MKNIKITPSDTWAQVNWEIVTDEKRSSYITQYHIYLNGTFQKTVARNKYGTQFNITGLKPYSNYNFGVRTVDGSSQNSSIRNQDFMTNEAGKYIRKSE